MKAFHEEFLLGPLLSLQPQDKFDMVLCLLSLALYGVYKYQLPCSIFSSFFASFPLSCEINFSLHISVV